MSAEVGTTAVTGAEQQTGQPQQQGRPTFGETIEGTAMSTTHQGRPVEIVESPIL